jgi:hypothetical protein
MKTTLGSFFLLIALFLDICRGADTKPKVEARTLTNGLRVVAIHFPSSTNASIYTFLPLSLTTDDAGQAQWSHLVEHLVIRSTIPDDSREANAETLPDHMRLDFYGNVGNWKEASLIIDAGSKGSRSPRIASRVKSRK